MNWDKDRLDCRLSKTHASCKSFSYDPITTLKTISIMHGNLQVSFIKQESAPSTLWFLSILNPKKSSSEELSIMLTDSHSIKIIHTLLENNQLLELSNFLENKGPAAKNISSYLKDEIAEAASQNDHTPAGI